MKLKSNLFYQTKILKIASFQAFQESLDAIPFFSNRSNTFPGFLDQPGCISRLSWQARMHFLIFITYHDAFPGFLDKPRCISRLSRQARMHFQPALSSNQDLNPDNLDFSRLFNCSISLSSRLSRFPWKQKAGKILPSLDFLPFQAFIQATFVRVIHISLYVFCRSYVDVSQQTLK